MLLACFQPATGVLSRRKEKDTATWRQDESRTKGKDDHQQVEEGVPALGRVKRPTCCLSLTGGHEFSDESPGNAHKAVLFHTQHMRYLSP